MSCEWIINSPCEQELYNVSKWFYAVAQLKLISGISTLCPPWGNIKGGGGNSLMKAKYHISSNNRHLSINHLPWIITSPWRKYLKINNPLPWIIPPPTPLLSFIQQSWSVMIQALMPRLLTLKITQLIKFGTLKKPMFSLSDMIIFFIT